MKLLHRISKSSNILTVESKISKLSFGTDRFSVKLAYFYEKTLLRMSRFLQRYMRFDSTNLFKGFNGFKCAHCGLT